MLIPMKLNIGTAHNERLPHGSFPAFFEACSDQGSRILIWCWTNAVNKSDSRL